MNNLKYFTLNTQHLDDFQNINKRLIEGLNKHIDDDLTRKSHFFGDRYENIYINNDKIPALSQILIAARTFAADILDCSANSLKAGLWFNVMNPGDETTMHRHDDDDELLSAVYYIQVAEESGTLQLEKAPIKIQVEPEQGMFVFFPPDLPHKVSKNLSTICRISLGINIGPV
jgi:hypothetical protein